jgi:hypothetical protein
MPLVKRPPNTSKKSALLNQYNLKIRQRGPARQHSAIGGRDKERQRETERQRDRDSVRESARARERESRKIRHVYGGDTRFSAVRPY